MEMLIPVNAFASEATVWLRPGCSLRGLNPHLGTRALVAYGPHFRLNNSRTEPVFRLLSNAIMLQRTHPCAYTPFSCNNAVVSHRAILLIHAAQGIYFNCQIV